jgi:hypothetical protein
VLKKFIPLVIVFLLMSIPVGAEDFNFMVFGDSRISFPSSPIPPAYKQILKETNLINPDLVFHTGDLVFGYGDSAQELKDEYASISNLMSTVIPKIYYVPGNHDYQNQYTTALFVKLTGQKEGYFSVKHKGATFIVLNTDIPGQVGDVAGEQRLWLEKELEKNKYSSTIFIFMHRPLFSFLIPDADKKGEYSHSPEYDFVSEAARKSLLDLITKYKVTAVFAGHEHLYYRVDYEGIPFITLGGGGAAFSAPPEKGGFYHYMIVSVSGDKVKLELMEPYQFLIEQRYYKKGSKTYGEAVIHDMHAPILKRPLPLRGIKFTLPKGKYGVAVDTFIPHERILKVEEAEDKYRQGSITEKVEALKIKMVLPRAVNASIYKIEPNKQDKNKIDVWVKANSPGTLSIRLTIKPE